VPNTRAVGVRRALLEVFRQFGLPRAIRSDNGSPFASRGPAGLSELSAWWLKLGIRHERIEPGKPQQNAFVEPIIHNCHRGKPVIFKRLFIKYMHVAVIR